LRAWRGSPSARPSPTWIPRRRCRIFPR
jgi:hypothetical protein